MRRRTRNAILAILAVLVALIALGAVPGLLKSGDPYYLTATAEGEWTGEGQAVNVSDLPERRYPYATAALSSATGDEPGRSEPYWEGPIGLKEAFTHSPFDELDALRQRNTNATSGDTVRVHDDATVYDLTISRELQ